jgi:hypothetical protein
VKEYLNLTDKCPVDSERRVAIHPTDESDGYSRHTIYKAKNSQMAREEE